MKRVHTLFALVSSLVVLAAVVWGFVLVGSPATVRLQRFDQQRLQDLQTIFREIQSLCIDPDPDETLKRPLPQTLDELALEARQRKINLTDPETGERYLYTVEGETRYTLCATFSLPREADTDVFWNHPADQHCYTIDVLDPP